jgi:hypothetical protein
LIFVLERATDPVIKDLDYGRLAFPGTVGTIGVAVAVPA